MIREGLEGRRVGVTGATGFLGTALVERLLRSVPGCELAVLVRPGRRGDAQARFEREVLRNNCFGRLRDLWGDRFDERVHRRVTVVAGDVGVDGLGLDEDGRSALRACDIVVHSAAAVSFDSPLDVAVRVNLLGPARVASAMASSSPSARSGPAHLIAVSTAYVAGTRRGQVPEALLSETPYAADIDWRAEVAAADHLRPHAELESREPERLARFGRQARQELGAAGTPLLAERTERIRSEWVTETLVEAGRARARALGWPDAYALTKALGERALIEGRSDIPVTIVRPSIIESALHEPLPGWIRGFRMADPIFIAYARGLLRQFPGIPEGVVDVIPVDLVVSAILAVAALGPPSSGASVVQVGSGSTNPLRYQTLVDLTREWFTEHPLYDRHGQPIIVPNLAFPGRGRAQQQLTRMTTGLSAAERLVSQLPIRGRRAEVAARIDEQRTRAERALGYVKLYGAYVESEAIFSIDSLMKVANHLDPDDRATFDLDPRSIDWRHYIHDIHLPAVVAHSRVRAAPGPSRRTSRREARREAVLSPARHLAAFDLENTLIASNVVESFAWLATRELSPSDRARFTLDILRQAPGLLRMDRRDRGDFLRYFYRRYEDAPSEAMRAGSLEMFSDLILEKSFPAAIRRVREHRVRGHRTVLVTGALDFVVEPLSVLFDDVVCARLGERNGTLTGQLDSAPPTGEARALLLGELAAAAGLSLAESVAYADSTSDLPMLEAVGHPVAVNPEPKLATIAQKRGWLVESWALSAGSRRLRLPMGPLAEARQ